MNNAGRGYGARFFCIAWVAVSLLLFLGVAGAQPADEEKNLGKSQQGISGGTLVSAADQERYGLLTLSTGCSASLLRNNWIITAAHCIDDPDPAMPGRFIMVPEDSVTLSAAWKAPQVRQSARIISFRPADVAIIRVNTPFSVNGSTGKFNREFFRDGELEDRAITVLGRGINQFAFVSPGGTWMPSQSDGQYRLGLFQIDRAGENSFGFPRTGGQSMAGGDSGGPSFITVNGNLVLAGVHSNCNLECAPKKTCGDWPGPGPAPGSYSNWEWVTGTPRCSDARISGVLDEIDRYTGAFVEPAQFLGTFAKSPANYQPMWVYAITDDGDLIWFRKDSGTAAWQGPKKVGNGWIFKDIIPAGGNSIYALTEEGALLWYRHDGFNDGSFNWKGPVIVGSGWIFHKIFSGGDGIVYAIREDGTLLWYQNTTYADAAGTRGWLGPREIGTGWESFHDIFSEGQGAVYAVKKNGDLVLYNQTGFATGDKSWTGPRTVGTGWADFQQIIPAGDGVILAIRNDGKLLWYKHDGAQPGPNPSGGIHEKWEGVVEIGSGWQGLRKVIALIPATAPPVVR